MKADLKLTDHIHNIIHIYSKPEGHCIIDDTQSTPFERMFFAYYCPLGNLLYRKIQFSVSFFGWFSQCFIFAMTVIVSSGSLLWKKKGNVQNEKIRKFISSNSIIIFGANCSRNLFHFIVNSDCELFVS